MKKFTSILCALVIALSASAVPQAKYAKASQAKVLTKEQRVAKRLARVAAQANGETINIAGGMTFSEESYYGMFSYGVVAGGNDAYEVEAYLYPDDDNFYTTYSTDDWDLELSVYDAEENEIELTATAQLIKLEKNGKQFVATGTDESGNTYNIDLKFIVPDAPKTTVNLDFGPAASAKYYSDGDWYFWGERADYVVGLDFYAAQDLVGQYTEEDFYAEYCGLYAVDGTDTTSVGDFFSAKVNVTLNEGVYTIAADLFMTDTVLYKVSMTYVKPVATDTIEHTFTEPVSLDKYDGDWYFLAKDANYVLAMDYYSETAAGEFGLADLYADYVGMGIINGTDTTDVSYLDIKLVVTESANQFDIKVTYLGEDLHCYIFYLVSKKATAETTEQVNWENADLTDVSAYSWYYGFSYGVLASNADSSLVFSLALNKETLVGNYTEADLNTGYTAIYVNNERFAIASAEFSVAAGENGSYVLTGWLLAKNNVKYEFVIKTAEQETQGIENAKAAGKATKRIENGQLLIEKNGKTFNVNGAIVK